MNDYLPQSIHTGWRDEIILTACVNQGFHILSSTLWRGNVPLNKSKGREIQRASSRCHTKGRVGEHLHNHHGLVVSHFYPLLNLLWGALFPAESRADRDLKGLWVFHSMYQVALKCVHVHMHHIPLCKSDWSFGHFPIKMHMHTKYCRHFLCCKECPPWKLCIYDKTHTQYSLEVRDPLLGS